MIEAGGPGRDEKALVRTVLTDGRLVNDRVNLTPIRTILTPT